MKVFFRNRDLLSKAYEEIKNRIIYFDLRPGDKIFESEIAKSLNISRTPVRESLLILENEGLVEHDSRLGFIVKRLSYKEVEEYFSIRNIIECYAVPLIVDRITPSELKALEKNVQQAEIHVEKNDLRKIIQYETEFHQILYQSVKSEVFFQTISGLIDKFHWLRAIALSAPGGAKISVDDHKKMFRAVQRRDARELKRLTQLHLRHARKYAVRQGIFL